jgi:hypothetical protein
MIEAMKQALEALEWNLPVIEDYGDKEQLNRQHKAIASLYQAIAEAKKQSQEPIGWLDEDSQMAEFMHKDLKAEHDKRGSFTPKMFPIPVYLHPQPKPKPEQEPVAWMTITDAGEEDDIWYSNPEGKLLEGWTYIPLFPHPQPKAEDYHALEQSLTRLQKRYGELEAKVKREPLTDEQIDAILIGLMRQNKSGAVTIARAIEAAHGIKGEA